AVLLSEQSRMSREDIFDCMQHWRRFRDAGVAIVTCQRGELKFDNLGGVITAIVDQYGARDESIKLAHRVASGQRLKVQQGQRIGGRVFAYDRELYDDKGDLVRRIHYQERFRKHVTWRSKLVPSEDAAAVEAVRWAFKQITLGTSVQKIVLEFNRRNLRTIMRGKFTYSTVNTMLRNPVYVGILRVGHYARGKFSRVAEDGIIEIDSAHEAIVSTKMFARVQEILDDRKAKRSYRPATRYLLSGLIRCAHCGQRMHGVRKIHRKTEVRLYQCGATPAVHGYVAGCRRPAIHVEKLDRFVIQTIQERLLGREAEKKIRESIIRAMKRETGNSSRDEKRLALLRSKIERGTENLALADKANFIAISKLLDQWRGEEMVLAESLEKNSRDLEPLPEALQVLSRLADVSKNLGLADRAKLKLAIHQTVRSISISVENTCIGEIEFRAYGGEIQFHEALGIPAIPIPDEAIGARRVWRDLGELVRKADRPLHLIDFAIHIGTKDLSRAAHHVRRSERAGLIKKIGHQGGWVSNG
ncbi:MAG: recombinase family protein, partial [Pirellula sp.]